MESIQHILKPRNIELLNDVLLQRYILSWKKTEEQVENPVFAFGILWIGPSNACKAFKENLGSGKRATLFISFDS